ncbi:hypothetical protein BJ546DRAFT_996484 [Cryomyces antarcticus]
MLRGTIRRRTNRRFDPRGGPSCRHRDDATPLTPSSAFDGRARDRYPPALRHLWTGCVTDGWATAHTRSQARTERNGTERDGSCVSERAERETWHSELWDAGCGIETSMRTLHTRHWSRPFGSRCCTVLGCAVLYCAVLFFTATYRTVPSRERPHTPPPRIQPNESPSPAREKPFCPSRPSNAKCPGRG